MSLEFSSNFQIMVIFYKLDNNFYRNSHSYIIITIVYFTAKLNNILSLNIS